MSQAEFGKPVTIIRCSETTGAPLSLNIKGLTEVFQQDAILNVPIAILSVAGTYRTGKSFLLNFLLRYLRAKEQKRTKYWLDDKDETLKGFDWKPGIDKTTEGILVWSRPFLLRHYTGKNVAVFLMDTQGLFDDDTLPENANAMIALSTLLSSIQVYNVVGKIQDDQLKSLEMFAEAGLMLTEKRVEQGTDQPFQRLIFLVRDWIGAKKHKFGEKGGRSYLEEKLEPRENQPLPLRTMRRNIRSSFQNLECFLMPHPGLKAAEETESSVEDDESDSSGEFSGKVSDLKKEFVEKLEEIVEFLFEPGRLKIKICEGKIVTGADIVDMIVSYARLFKEGKVPLPGTTRRAMIDEHNKIQLKEAMSGFGDELWKEINSGSTLCPEEFQSRFGEEKIKCLAFFESCCRGTKAEVEQIKKRLLSKIKEQQTNMQAEYTSNQLLVQKRNEGACRKILANAKHNYKQHMEEHIGTGQMVLSSERLHSVHDQVLEIVWTFFKTGTRGMGNEKIPFEEELRKYMDSRLQSYAAENDTRRAEKNEKHLKCIHAVGEAMDHYIKEMDTRYDIGMKPSPEKELLIFHRLCIEKAECFLQMKIKTITQESSEYKEKLDGDCKKELERFRSKNSYNKEKKKNCKVGQDHMNPEEMASLHGRGLEAAMGKFRKYTQNCDKIPEDWHDQLKEIVNDEKGQFNNINHLNSFQNALT